MNPVQPRILVVDDEPGVLLTVSAILTREGYDVTSAGGGKAALEAIQQRYYDLVLTDLKMPLVDGLAVLAHVRKCSPDTVTVMMTGYGSVDSAMEALRLGAYEYLLKPIGVEDLKAAVGRSLERKRLSEIDTLYRISRTLSGALDTNTIRAGVREAVPAVLGLAHVSLLALSREPAPLDASETLRPLVENPSVLALLQAGATVTSEDAPQEARQWAAEAGSALSPSSPVSPASAWPACSAPITAASPSTFTLPRCASCKAWRARAGWRWRTLP